MLKRQIAQQNNDWFNKTYIFKYLISIIWQYRLLILLLWNWPKFLQTFFAHKTIFIFIQILLQFLIYRVLLLLFYANFWLLYSILYICIINLYLLVLIAICSMGWWIVSVKFLLMHAWLRFYFRERWFVGYYFCLKLRWRWHWVYGSFCVLISK